MKLLLCEDEIELADGLSHILKNNNYSVDVVYDGEEALDYLNLETYDGIILDIMMPKVDGITVLKIIRKNGIQTPVLLLTAKSQTDDKVLGLDSGADDYLTKPFESKELLARVRAITRRQSEATDTILTMGNISLDRATYVLSSDNGHFKLANKEFQMMEMLLINPDQLISVEQFMDKIWGYDSESEINVVWVYISYLRKKLAVLESTIEIKASRNAGYYLKEK